MLVLALAGLVHVPYDPVLLLGIIGLQVPWLLEIGIVLALGLAMLVAAIARFSRTE